jgi:polyisoprenoid-binding protein YceI
VFARNSLAAAIAALSFAAAADNFTIDADHTFPSLEMTHMGISIWRGKFNRSSGKVTLDRAAGTGSAEIRVDAASIDFGHDKMNEFALGADWLDAAKHPTMTYKGALRFEGGTPVAVEGKLTLLGVTRPVSLKINSFKCIDHPYFRKEVCGADAEGELDRADFGMAKYSEGGAGRIRLRIQVEAIREG